MINKQVAKSVGVLCFNINASQMVGSLHMKDMFIHIAYMLINAFATGLHIDSSLIDSATVTGLVWLN